MTVRIWDTSVLDEVADFSVSLPIGESAYNVKNADGSTPSVTLKVEGTSRKFALQVLSSFNETEDMLSIILASLLGDEWVEIAERDPQAVADKLEEISAEFMTFRFNAITDTEETATLTLTAPSGIIALRAFHAMTSKRYLQSIANNWMPLAEDDDDEFFYNGDDDEDY